MKMTMTNDSDEDENEDFNDEEAKEKAPVEKSVQNIPAKNAQKSNQNFKT